MKDLERYLVIPKDSMRAMVKLKVKYSVRQMVTDSEIKKDSETEKAR